MERMGEKRFLAVAGIALFICFIFVWGTWNLKKGNKVLYSAESSQTRQPKKKPTSTASGNAVDIKALANALLKEVKYDTDLQKMDAAVSEGMVDLQDGSVLEMHMGDGTCSDELLIVTSANDKLAKKDQTAVENHLKDMKKSFADYIPEQAEKIEKAVIVRCGSYVVACVTNDADHAKEIIVKAFQE